MRFFIQSIFALATATLAVARPATEKLSINPRHLEPQTNAKRFAAGLPPLPPTVRYHRAPIGGSGVDTARRTVVSPAPPVTVKCNLLLNLGSTIPGGYISPELSERGSYSTLQTTQDGALELEFSYRPDDPTSLEKLELLATNNSNGTYPWFGATAANQDTNEMGWAIINYATIASTAQTGRGSPPVATSSTADPGSLRGTESAVWKYDPATGKITAQWINPDGSTPETWLIYVPGGLFVLTGNPAIVLGQFRGSRTADVTCVPSI